MATFQKHKDDAAKSHQDYQKAINNCHLQWTKIKELEKEQPLTLEATQQVEDLKKKFILVIAMDYQVSKLVPSWGQSPQPGSTYYLQKLSHDIMGIVNHGTNRPAIYIFDKLFGPKNTNHSLSYLCQLPPWVKRVHLFMDNVFQYQ